MSPKNQVAEDELPVFVEVEQADEFLEPDLSPSVDPQDMAEAITTDDSKGESVDEDTANEATTSDYIKIVYLGAADVVSFGPYKFRPGVPVFLPKHNAEELLTLPHEKFEVKE